MSIQSATILSPTWHAGEIAMQRHAGVAERMEEFGPRVIRDHLIDQHRAFYPLLPSAVFGAVDPDGAVWATLRAAKPGFLESPDPLTLHVSLPRDSNDPAEGGMEDGDAIALLGIELHTRRRNRLNGVIRRQGRDGFDISVRQSYGNCPKYIQQRHFEFVREPGIPQPRRLDHLDAEARAMITSADTFFVASSNAGEGAERQVDVSHRGGNAGFVRLGEDGVLAIPDFIGNKFFNTLGNFRINPRAGLVFVDFQTGDLLQLSGLAEVVLESPEIAAFKGAERLWRFRPKQIVHRPQALPLRWTFEPEGWSPYAVQTGHWNADT